MSVLARIVFAAILFALSILFLWINIRGEDGWSGLAMIPGLGFSVASFVQILYIFKPPYPNNSHISS